MILDTSALIAIFIDEDDAPLYLDAMSRAPVCRMSAGSFLELFIVIERQRHGQEVVRQAEAFLRQAGVAIEPVTMEQAYLARQAYLDFGKGRHKAGLNFGDCFAYALARFTGEPLLYKGQDFAGTDVVSAV